MKSAESHIYDYPPTVASIKVYTHQYEQILRSAMTASQCCFSKAIYLSEHYGAHYSLSLLLKLHQRLLESSVDTEEAHEHMCSSLRFLICHFFPVLARRSWVRVTKRSEVNR